MLRPKWPSTVCASRSPMTPRVLLPVLAATVLAGPTSLQAPLPERAAEQRSRPPDAAPQPPEAHSRLGEPLFALVLAPEQRTILEANLAAAEKTWVQNPDEPENVIWVGRRLAYLGRYREAI